MRSRLSLGLTESVNENPLVSVVTIFLNEEKFLQEALESVLAQNYQNWELILVDDGSVDDSARIASHFQSKYPARVTCLSHADRQNRGMSASRNLGLTRASGRYVAFLDADDVWDTEFLRYRVDILESHADCSMVSGAAHFWYGWTGGAEDAARDEISLHHGDLPLNTAIAPPDLLAAFLVDEGITPQSPLIRRAAIEQVKGYEESFRGMYEDQVLYAKLGLVSSAIISDDCLFHYRRHENSCVTVANRLGQKVPARRQFLEWMTNYLAKSAVDTDDLMMIVRSEFQLMEAESEA